MPALKSSASSVDPVAAPRSGDASARVIAFRPRQSSGHAAEVGFGQRSPSSRRRSDPLAVYAGFSDLWSGFLVARFNNDPVEVAHFFRITTKAAEKWLAGIGGPHGAKLFYALSEIEGAYEALFGAAPGQVAMRKVAA